MTSAHLKAGWRMVKFGDIAENIAVRVSPAAADTDVYVGLEHLEPETLHLRRWGHPSDVEGDKLRFRKGDVIFARRRAYQRKLALAEFDGICSAHAMVIRAKPKMILPEFLPFFLQSDMFMERAIEISVGSLSPTINWKTLRVQEFPLPPVKEQKRFTEILWAVDEALETKRKALEDCHRSMNVTAAHVLLKGLKGGSLKNSPVGNVPILWDVVKLGDVSDVVYGVTLNSKRSKLPVQKAYLRVANVQRGRLDLNVVNDIGCTENEFSQYELQKNDILVVEGHADVNEIGRAAIWNCEVRDCIHQNHLLRVRCNSKLLPPFALAWLNSPRGRSCFRRMAQSTSGLNTINSTVLKNLPIPLPDKCTQQAIVQILSRHKAAIDVLEIDIKTTARIRVELTSEFIPMEGSGASHV